MDINLFDYFDEAGGEGDTRSRWTLRAPYRPHERFDLMVVPQTRDWQEDSDSLAALEQIEQQPWVAAVERGEKHSWLRLDDEWVAQRGAELEQWREVKRAASEAIVACGATITHHHAVGRDHAPYMEAEVGSTGLDTLRAVKNQLDPAGIMNPGKLLI